MENNTMELALWMQTQLILWQLRVFTQKIAIFKETIQTDGEREGTACKANFNQRGRPRGWLTKWRKKTASLLAAYRFTVTMTWPQSHWGGCAVNTLCTNRRPLVLVQVNVLKFVQRIKPNEAHTTNNLHTPSHWKPTFWFTRGRTRGRSRVISVYTIWGCTHVCSHIRMEVFVFWLFTSLKMELKLSKHIVYTCTFYDVILPEAAEGPKAQHESKIKWKRE